MNFPRTIFINGKISIGQLFNHDFIQSKLRDFLKKTIENEEANPSTSRSYGNQSNLNPNPQLGAQSSNSKILEGT